MKITQRFIAFSFLILAALAFTAATPKPPADSRYLAFVGTYTGKTGSKGIYTVDFDSASGKLTPRGLAAESIAPAFVVIHPNGKFAYAANEAGKQSTITAFAIDASSAKLTLLNQLPALGDDPCHLSFDKSGKYLFAANYSSGSVTVFPLLPDGRLGEHTALVQHHGSGPNKERQEAPHAHWVEPSPDNSLVFVSALGLDQILISRLDAAKGTLTANDPPFAKLAPASGPR